MKASKKFHQKIKVTSLRNLESRVKGLLKNLTKEKSFTNLPRAMVRDLGLILREGITNAFHHGAGGKKNPVGVALTATPKQIEIKIEDRGKGFRLASVLKNQPGDWEARGRGLWIMKNLSDRISYQRGRPNRLVLVKKLTRPKKLDSAIELFDQLQEVLQKLGPKQALYEEFVDFIVGLFNVERASLLTYDSEKEKLRVATSRGIRPKVAAKIAIRPGEGIAGYVFETARPLLVNNLRVLKEGIPQPRKKGYATQSFVSVPVIASPLHVGEETLGVLNLTDKRDGSRFTQAELKLLSLMASQAASVFRIRDLIDTVKRHEGIQKELQIAHDIQDRLLLEDFPQLPGTEIGGRCELSPRGGGDYYDLIEVNGKLRGVIADVSGHHVGSAITMSSFRSTFRSLVYDLETPGEILRGMRWALHEDLIKLNQFISCWVFEYQSDGTMTLSGAGHPPLLLYRSLKKKWEDYFSEHLPLGLEDEAAVQNTKLTLKINDLALFYTDGLFDPRMRATGFDKESFCEFVQENVRVGLQELVDHIFEEVASHRLAIKSPDDVAVLALRKK